MDADDRPPPPTDRPDQDQADESWRYPPPPAADAAGVPAAWGRRAVAYLIDILIVAAPLGVLGAMFGWAEVIRDGDSVRYEAKPILLILSSLVTLLYSTVMDGSARGQTVGKMAMRLQVRDATTGGPIGPGRAFGRRLVYLLLFQALLVPGLINALSPLWDRRHQGWHDKAVNSVVVNAA